MSNADQNNPWAATEDDYAQIGKSWQQQQAAQIRANAIMVSDTSPDQIARQRQVAQRVGLPVAAVTPAPAVPSRQAAGVTIDHHTQGAPVARRSFTDPQFAAVAHDDSHGLGLLDRFMAAAGRFGTNIGQRIGSAFQTTPDNPYAATQQKTFNKVGDAINGFQGLFGYGANDWQNTVQASLINTPKALAGLPPQVRQWAARGAAVSPTLAAVANVLPGMDTMRPIIHSMDNEQRLLEARVHQHGKMATVLKFGASVLPYLAAGEFAPVLMGAEAAGGSAERADAEGQFGTGSADTAAALHGTLGWLLGRAVGSDVLASKIGGAVGDTLAQGLGGGTANLSTRIVGGLSESLATPIARMGLDAGLFTGQQFAGNVIDKATYAPDRDLSEGLTDSALQGALMGLGFHVIHSVGSSVSRRYANAIESEAGSQYIDGLHMLAEASKVRERAPDVWQSYLQELTQEHGTPDSVYVTPDAFNKAFSTPEGQVALSRMPEAVKDAVGIAAKTGGDIKIPVDEFGTYIAGTPAYEQLADHVKVDPNSYTRAEASEVLKTEGPRILAELQRAVGSKQATDEFHASRDRVEKQVTDQLGAAGRYSPEVNAINAKLGAHSIAVHAARVGMVPEEFFAKHGFSVSDGTVRTRGQALEQNDVRQWASEVEQRLGLKSFDVWPSRDALKLNMLIVNKDGQRQGVGTQAMRELTAYADAHNKRVVLSPALPDDMHGTTSRARLVKFYKRFGFVENKGRNKDFTVSEGMIREPRSQDGAVARDAFANEGLNQSIALKALVNRSGLSAERLSDIFKGPAKVSEVDSLGSVPSFSAMLSHVRSAALDDPKVLDSIVRLVPVDMVNNLFGSERAAKVALHDEPMFKNAPAFDADLAVSHLSDSASPVGLLIKEAARVAAEVSRASDAGFEAGERDATLLTDNGDTLAQNTDSAQEPRGRFIPQTNTIELLRNANLTTFLHELGHYHLETLAKFADSHPDVAGDFDKLLKWFDPELTRDKWNAMSFEERRAGHEKFAQGFEKYLFEGKAPTRELRGVFQRMAAWLKSVYKSLAGLNVELTPEVRGVMDRLVATPDEIRSAEHDMGYAPLFAEKPEFMSDDQWEAYQSLGQQATMDATEKLSTRTIRDLQWFEGAKSRELKRLQAQHAELRKGVRDEVTQEVMQTPVERVREFARFGRMDGQKIEGPTKLSIDGVAKALGIEKSGGKSALHPDFEVKGPTLIEWISKRGGIWDGDPRKQKDMDLLGEQVSQFKGGDLKAIGLGDWHKQKAFRKKVIRDPKMGHGDRGIDNVLTDAIHAGYFPELQGAAQDRYADLHDPQILVDAINAELSGRPRYAEVGEVNPHGMTSIEESDVPTYAAWIEDEAETSFGIERGSLDQDFLQFAARLKIKHGGDEKQAFIRAVNEYAAAAIEAAHNEAYEAEHGQGSASQDRAVAGDYEGQEPVGDGATPGASGADLTGKDPAEIKAALGYGKYGVLARDNALDPELVADQFGYVSAREMLNDLVTSPRTKDKIASLTDQRMLERYGDVGDPKAMSAAAIEAVHNDARGRMLATEYSAITKALGRKSELTKAAKDMAEQVVGGFKVVELNPERFRAEERKAGERADRARRDNDLETAAAEKRNQLLNFHLARVVDKARDETAKALTYFKGLNKPSGEKARGGAATAQINAILERYDLRASTTNKAIEERQSLLEWVADQQAQGFDPQIDPAVMNEASRQSYKAMTVDELRALRDTIKSIDHIGRQEQKVLDGQRRVALDNAVNEILFNTADMPRAKVSDVRNPEIGGKGLDRFSNKLWKARSVVRSADAALLKMEQLFDWLDRKNPNGTFNRLVFRRLADAQGVESDMLVEIAGKMRELAEALPRDERSELAERITIPELIDSKTGRPSVLAKSQLLSMALNSANESNFDKMLRGERWEADAVKTVLDRHLSAHDIAYVNGVIRAIESLWPKISAMQERLSGVAPEKIEGRPLELANGTIEGGYFPVVYDPSRDYDVARRDALDMSKRADQMFDAQYVKATTSKGHTIERTAYAAPILLDLNVIPRHVSQVVHDLAYREVIMDADRLLTDSRVRTAVTEVMGPEYYNEIRPWLKAIANDRVIDQKGMAFFDKVFHWGRTTTTMIGLGFRASTMMVHGTSAASNSVAEVGGEWMRKGVAGFLGSPEKMRDAYNFVTERSPEMRHRMNELDRDVRESIREMEMRSAQGSTAPAMRALDKVREKAFWGIGALDMASALPTWLGAYMKAMSPAEKGGLGMGENDAIYYADKAVRNAHGGGGIKDLARAQRGSEAEKLFTMFYSFWNHIYNRQRDLFRDARNIQSASDFGNIVMRSWFYMVVPQILHGLLKTPSGDDDEHGGLVDWLKWSGEEIALGVFSGVPFVRDIANSAITGRDYEATPAAKIANDLITEVKDISKAANGEEIHNPVKHAATTAGILFNLPLGQIGGTAQYLWDVIDGDEKPEDIGDWWHGIVYGKGQTKH